MRVRVGLQSPEILGSQMTMFLCWAAPATRALIPGVLRSTGPTIVVEVHHAVLPTRREKLRISGSRAAPPQATPTQT